MPLLSLPDELLDLIFSNVISSTLPCNNRKHHRKENFPTPCQKCWITRARSVRQVCKRFSRLYSVNSALFRRVQLIADTQYRIGEEELKASGIAKYVEHLVLVQPLYACMEFNEWTKLFSSSRQAPYKIGPYATIKGRAALKKCKQHLPGDKHIVGAHTMTELKNGYKRYNDIASETLGSLRDHSLLESWTALLKMFSNCSSFEIPLVDYYNVGVDFIPMRLSYRPSWHQERYLHQLLEDQSFSLAQLFVPQVLGCLAAAQCKIQEIEFSHAYDPRSAAPWRSVCNWADLDFSELTNLTLDLFLPVEKYNDDEFEQRNSKLSALQEDVDHLLEACAPSLEYFSHSPCLNAWSGTPTALPKLLNLRLDTCEVSSRWFSQWLSMMPRLRTLAIGENGIGFMQLHIEPDRAWKTVFDALRDHPALVSGNIKIDALTSSWQRTLTFDKNNVLEAWDISDKGLDRSNPGDLQDIEYYEEKLRQYTQALDNPQEIRRLLDDEFGDIPGDNEKHLHLARFYVCGKIDWPGNVNMQLLP